MGLGYALSSLVGGYLAATDVRLAYACSCALGLAVVGVVLRGLSETLPPEQRKPFKAEMANPFVFVRRFPAHHLAPPPPRRRHRRRRRRRRRRHDAALLVVTPAFLLWQVRLFRRGALMRRLNLVLLAQMVTNGLGDLWQIIAVELRGWGPSQCGRFASVAGIASMGGTLLTGQSVRRLGPRGHTVLATSASALSSTVMAQATSSAAAFSAVVPMAAGAAKGQAASARITNLADEQGVPQGQLAAERNTLNAAVKVLARRPSVRPPPPLACPSDRFDVVVVT